MSNPIALSKVCKKLKNSTNKGEVAEILSQPDIKIRDIIWIAGFFKIEITGVNRITRSDCDEIIAAIAIAVCKHSKLAA